MSRVLVFGYYGMGNVGSEARLKVIIDDIKHASPEAEITVALTRTMLACSPPSAWATSG